MRVAASLALSLGLLLLVARVAQAGGFEYAGAGPRALGRGGAVLARADDALVLANNPAGLAELEGAKLQLDLNVALFDACVEAIGYYGWGAYRGGSPSELRDPNTGDTEVLMLGNVDEIGRGERRYYNDPLDTVCLRQRVVPVPQLVMASRVSRRLGLGFGFVFPAAQPSGTWGGDDGVIRGASGDLRPSPTRYMLLSSDTLGIFPTLGFGYRVSDVLRIGVALQWGLVFVDSRLMASSNGGTSPSNDILVHVTVRDHFVPAVTSSVHVVPSDSVDLVAAFKWQDDVDAHGELGFATSAFAYKDPDANNPNVLVRHTTNDLDVLSARQRMPWKLSLGARVASRLAPRPRTESYDTRRRSGESPADPLRDERFDVELDAEYLIARNEAQELRARPGQAIEYATRGGDVRGVEYPEPSIPVTRVEKRWRDQLSLRLGGTYNVLPGVLGVSAGTHYETRGVDPSYMQVDYWPLARVGLHAGFIVRLWQTVDVSVAYAHIFQETLTVAPPPHGERVDGGFDKRVGTQVSREEPLPILEEPAVGDADARARLRQTITKTAAGDPPWIVNSGRYRSSFDVLAVGILAHF